MNATTASGLAHDAGVVIVLIIAAAAGMAVGNVLRDRVDTAAAGPNIGGYVTDNPGGSIVRSRTAESAFSLEAIEQLNQIRANEAAAAAQADDTSDYGLRHLRSEPSGPDDDARDYGLRHR